MDRDNYILMLTKAGIDFYSKNVNGWIDIEIIKDGFKIIAEFTPAGNLVEISSKNN